jgi:hypothetical protein
MRKKMSSQRAKCCNSVYDPIVHIFGSYAELLLILLCLILFLNRDPVFFIF